MGKNSLDLPSNISFWVLWKNEKWNNIKVSFKFWVNYPLKIVPFHAYF